MSSPWAKISQPELVNLDEIMSEEVARELQSKENRKVPAAVATIEEVIEIPPELLVEDELEASDMEIAKMLQQQYDKEYDVMLKRTENKLNESRKIAISFSNYRRAPINPDFESDSEEEELEDLRDRKDWDRFDSINREFDAIPACGYHKSHDGNMVTKHDLAMNSRRNACKLMSFPPDVDTGDAAGFDLKISNKVFNSLRLHSKQDEARRHRMRDKREDHATAEFGMDEYTRLLLYKMINRQLLESVNGVISIGKEAVVLHANSDPSYPDGILPKECAIKVFKTTLSEYKQRQLFIKDDYRFKDRVGKQSARRTVHLWAEKEMHNLNRLRKTGIPCPEVVELKMHVLVMSFIGENQKPARKLKDAEMSDADYIVAYEQIKEAMKSLFTTANLVHADLSEYNILWFNGLCYFIDVSQAIEPSSHENWYYLLMRDCTNITNFFSKKQVPGVLTEDQLFEFVVGADFKDRVALSEVQESVKMKPHLLDRADIELNYKFETAWEKSKDNKLIDVPLVDAPLA